MSFSDESPRVVPAQLDFLTIYNPTLGTSDESLKDQILYYYSKQGHKKTTRAKGHDEGGSSQEVGRSQEDEENEKLRQIGLAQGMVAFAKNFSNEVNVDSIETEKSRIVLHELEAGWWILASIDLTCLPAAKQNQERSSSMQVEYSAREVSPPQLLLTDLLRAHSIFLLHHAPRLSELFERVGRELFCGLLERFWNRFARDWEVLLHGNPGTTIYNAIKLAGGGELGVGVGEEDWGSGEREVFESFMDRTEGLMDLIVGRYGEIPQDERNNTKSKAEKSDVLLGSPPWLGVGEDAGAADGLIFTGRGAISSRSLRTVSQWMESIFKHGDRAYGIGENPSSRPRQRRKRPKLERKVSEDSSSSQKAANGTGQEVHPRYRSPKARTSDLRREAMERNASPPGIPAPLVGKVERSLDEAIAKASQRPSDHSTGQENTEAETPKQNSAQSQSDNSVFGTENMVKYLTLGYGSSWTLNPKGLNSAKSREPGTSTLSGNTPFIPKDQKSDSAAATDEQGLQEVDPTPEVSDDESKPFVQRLEQSIGKFLVGLSGDLEQAELDTDNEANKDEQPDSSFQEQRIFLRTITVEMSSRRRINTVKKLTRSMSKDSVPSVHSTASRESQGASQEEPKTSAAASIDGAQPNITHEKVQVAVYVHQPFIFIFLFELRTPNLTIPAFYRSIHNQLGPLQKPLLRSTDPARVAERLADAMHEESGVLSRQDQTTNTIYDLVYDPSRLTIRTSVPNIPVPGSLAAEGLSSNSSGFTMSGSWYTLGIPVGSPQSTTSPTPGKSFKSHWSRVEALNVHTQILNSWSNTRNSIEIENTVKTSRGWWVLWMRVASRGEHGGHREAFLVRKAADYKAGNTNLKSISTGPGKWLLRDQPRDVSSGSSKNSGSTNAKGVGDGVGVDARKWIDALLHLTQ